MDAFSYLSVLLSIIIGLAITQVLQGYRQLMLARDRVRFDALPLVWSVLTLVFATQSWWASFGLAHHKGWSFVGFGAVLFQTVMLYLFAGVTLPDAPPGHETVDLREHYARERKPLFLLLIALLVSSLLKDVALDGRLPPPINLGFHLVLVAAAGVGLAFRGRGVQLGVMAAAIAWTAAYIAALFARL